MDHLATEELLRQLQEKDLLIQQLAQELIQINQLNRSLQQTTPYPRAIAVDPGSNNGEEVLWLKRQLEQAREEVATKQKENLTLLDSLQQVQQENQKLQQYLRDLPDMYRRKFTERMEGFKERMSQIQEENRRLQEFIQTTAPSLPEAATTPLLPPSE